MRGLNLGCGSRFHADWVNVDGTPLAPGIMQCDFRQALPFPDEHFDVVYQSHVLEHLRKSDAERFLAECLRVLKPGGIVRVAVPDLEVMAKLYLEALQNASNGDEHWQDRYDWLLIEMYDQATRTEPYGQVYDYLKRASTAIEEFVSERLGTEGNQLIAYLRTMNGRPVPYQVKKEYPFLSRTFRRIVENLMKRMAPDEWEALELGRFRLSGELHQWMYDRFSLARLLQQVGFANPKRVSAYESAIPNWESYHLDSEPDGAVCKADSLFMEAEALKP